MTELQKTLAKITRADIGMEDHGIYGVNIDFDYGGSAQGTGWYSISNESGGPLIEAIMEAVGVRRWDQMVGKTVFALRDPGYNGLVRGIEKLPTEKLGGTLIFSDFFAPYEAKQFAEAVSKA